MNLKLCNRDTDIYKFGILNAEKNPCKPFFLGCQDQLRASGEFMRISVKMLRINSFRKNSLEHCLSMKDVVKKRFFGYMYVYAHHHLG